MLLHVYRQKPITKREKYFEKRQAVYKAWWKVLNELVNY